MDAALESDRLARVERLNNWLRSRGITFRNIAEQYGCHWTYPGKVLKAETVEMPKRFRVFMTRTLGCPEDLLPAPGDKKKGTTRNQERYQKMKENARSRSIQALLEERQSRTRKDISLTVGV